MTIQLPGFSVPDKLQYISITVIIMTSELFEQTYDLFINAADPFDYENRTMRLTNANSLYPGSLLRCKIQDKKKEEKRQPYDAYPLMLVLTYNKDYIMYVNLNSFDRDQLKIVMSAVIGLTGSFCRQAPNIQPLDIIKIIENFHFSRRKMIRTVIINTVKEIRRFPDDLACIEALSKNDLTPDYFVNTTREKYRSDIVNK